MKAVIINEHGSADVLQYTEDFPTPTPADNEVLLKVHAVSLNRVDTVVRKGYPGQTIPMPHILGGDMAGVVEQAAKNSDKFKVGDRVVVYPIKLPEERDPHYGENTFLNDGWQFFGMQRHGAYAEYIAVPEENLVKISDNVSFEEAAALPIAGLTAYHAIFGTVDLKPDDVFFIWGGSGGLGTFAVQLAKQKGAKVIATVGKNYKKSVLESLGADLVLNHHEDDVVAETRKFAPKGVDLLIDYVGPATFDKSFSLVRKNGTIIACGMLTGMEVKLHYQQFYFRHLNLRGIFLGPMNEFVEFVEMKNQGQIKSHIHQVFDLKDAADAHRLLESGNYVGKIVLKIS
jgi:NADPH:quinone reductase-like Zn-dependent oxidoreductase